MAAALLRLKDQGLPGVEASPNLEPLERLVLGEPILAPLKQLQESIVAENWNEVISQAGPIRQRLRNLDPELSLRLTRVLIDPVQKAATQTDRKAGERLMARFFHAVDPLPIDPHWNRLWALVWEHVQGESSVVLDYWRKYLTDLKTAPGFRSEDRPIAQALVWAHMAKCELDESGSLTPSLPFAPKPSQRAVSQAHRRAVAAFEESLKLYPGRQATYYQLIEAYESWDQPDESAAVARRLVTVHPNEFEALLHLCEYHRGREEFDLALNDVLSARRLKPLDDEARFSEWSVRIGLARYHAIRKRWDEGRAELEAAGKLFPEKRQSLHFQAREAVFELAAGASERAEDLIKTAQASLAEPMPLWLALSIEAIRHRLPRVERDRFENQWINALTTSRKSRGDTAGELARLLGPFVAGGSTPIAAYAGRDQHVAQVVGYLRKTTRIKYQERDLRAVCEFLSRLPQEQALLAKLVARGHKLYPDSAYYIYMIVSFEIEKGPLKTDVRKVRTNLERARALVEASSDPEDRRLIPLIQKSMAFVETITTGFGFGFPGGGPMPGLFDLFEAMSEHMGIDFDDLDDVDDEFDDGFEDKWAFRPRPSPGPRRTPKKKSKTEANTKNNK